MENPTKKHREMIASRIRELGRIPVYKFGAKCWKCGKGMEIFTYLFNMGYDFSIGSIRKFDRLLGKRYGSVKKGYSKMLKKEAFMNTCGRCGTQTGNYFVMEIIVEERKLNKKLDKFEIGSLDAGKIVEKDLDFTDEEFNGLLEMC